MKENRSMMRRKRRRRSNRRVHRHRQTDRLMAAYLPDFVKSYLCCCLPLGGAKSSNPLVTFSQYRVCVCLFVRFVACCLVGLFSGLQSGRGGHGRCRRHFSTSFSREPRRCIFRDELRHFVTSFCAQYYHHWNLHELIYHTLSTTARQKHREPTYSWPTLWWAGEAWPLPTRR